MFSVVEVLTLSVVLATVQCVPLVVNNAMSVCDLYDPCLHGQCSSRGGKSFCTCEVGWTGVNCDIDVDECASSAPCQNGGVCTNQPGTYSCICEPGWIGTRCQIRWKNV